MEQINLTIFNMINGFARMNGILDAITTLFAKYMPFLFIAHFARIRTPVSLASGQQPEDIFYETDYSIGVRMFPIILL